MGKLVNVIIDGKTVAIPEEDAARLEGAGRGRRETDQESVGRAVDAANAERASGIGQGAKTFVEGTADAVTGGLFGKVAGYISPEYGEELANRGQHRSGLRTAGELAGFLVPGGLPQLANKAGKAVTGHLAAQAVNPLTRGATASVNAAGRAVEGAIAGAGGHVATTNVTGDPLTIEGTLLSMGIGSVINVGIGAASDRVRRMGDKAKGVLDEHQAVKQDVAIVQEGREVFAKPRESWEGFKESVKSVAAEDAKVIAAENKVAKEYLEWAEGPKSAQKINGALKQAEKARNEVQARLSQTKYGKAISETGEALDEASGQLGKLKGKADKLTSSTEDWPSTMKSVDDAISQVRGRYAPKGADDPLYKPKLEGYTGSFDERGAFDKGEAFHTAKKKMPISESLDKELTEFSQRASRIRQMRQGGYALKGGKWVRDANAKANPEAALEELHKLREDFSKRFGGVEFPDLPAIPKVAAPIGVAGRADDVVPLGPANEMDEVKRLAQTSRELTDGINAARAKFKAGDKEGALDELRELQARAAANGQNDLVLPSIPVRKAPVPPAEPVRIPKTLLELARMEAPTVQRLSAAVAKDPRAAAEFQKLANELGVDAADGLAGVHAKLGKYITADQKLITMAKKEAEDEAGDGLLAFMRRGAKKFARYGAARAADGAMGGGLAGSFGRVFAGETAGAAMNVTEDLIGGSMMKAKAGITQIVAGLVNKAAPPTSTALRKLGPITAYLKSSPLSGEEDKENDPGVLTVKRINEAVAAAGTAPDAVYIAVQSLLGHASDVGFKMHQKIVGDLQHLVEVAPKDPGIAMHGLKSDWTPSPDESLTFAYRIEAVVNPLKAIQRTIAGDGHPAAVETLWLRWPALMQTAAEEFSYALHEMGDMSVETATNFSSLFRTPITGLADPTVMLEIQGLYLPRPEEGAGQVNPSTGAPVGRPAAVQSSVAGSSVSGLISQ